MNIQKVVQFLDIFTDAQVTYNTMEQIFNKLDTLTAEQMLNISNYVAIINRTSQLENDQLKNLILPKVQNELEVYVSQL